MWNLKANQRSVCTLFKSVGSILHLDRMTVHCFVIPWVGHLENTGLLNYAVLLNCWHYNTLIKISLLIYLVLSKKSLVLGSCQAQGDGKIFFKILIFFWKVKFYHWQQMLSVVFPKWQAYFIYFRGNISWITIVLSVILSS